MKKATLLSKTSVHRLTVLADFLDKLPTTVFNLGGWIEHNGHPYLGNLIDTPVVEAGALAPGTSVDEMHACGATACAVGWACTITEFVKAGLTLSIPEGNPHFEGKDSFDAATAFFQLPAHDYFITSPVSSYLFSTMEYKEEQVNDPRAVSARIRLYLSDPWG